MTKPPQFEQSFSVLNKETEMGSKQKAEKEEVSLRSEECPPSRISDEAKISKEMKVNEFPELAYPSTVPTAVSQPQFHQTQSRNQNSWDQSTFFNNRIDDNSSLTQKSIEIPNSELVVLDAFLSADALGELADALNQNSNGTDEF